MAASTIDKVIMDNFYKLVHTQPNVRLTAACSTFKILTAMKNNKAPNFNEHLNYCIERLVAGLASARALARRGYATLLLEILKKHQVSSERLFTLAQQKFGNISNETSKDNLLAYYLLVNVVIESGNHEKTKQNITYVEKMYKILRQLTDHKSYFDVPVSKLLTERFEIFYEYMLGEIPPAAFGSDARLTHLELLNIALCNKHKPISQLADLGSADILRMSQVMLGDKLKRRPIHPVWVEWSKTIMVSCSNHFPTYITEIVLPNFFKPNHNELASMGLELVARLIRESSNPANIEVLLDDYIIRLLITSLRNKDSLHKHCIEFFATLRQYFKDYQKSQESSRISVQQMIFQRLTSSPGSLTFDEDSKSHMLSGLLNECHPDALVSISNIILKNLNSKMNRSESKRVLPTVGKLLAHIVLRPQMSNQPEHAIRLAKTLIVESLFRVVNPSDKSFWNEKRLSPATQNLGEATRSSLKGAYYATLDHIISHSQAKERVETLGLLVDFCNELIHSKAVDFLETSGNISQLWEVYMTSLSKYRKLCKINDNPKILYPISSLFLLYGLQVVEHGLNCCEQLDDLQQAAQDSLKNDPNDGSWADILTDQIISILSATECKTWIRKLCVSVFGSLLPHISETSIDLLCDVIKAPLDSACDEDDEDGEELSDMEEQDMSIDQEGVSMAEESDEVGAKQSEDEKDEEMEFTDGTDSDGEDSQSDIDMLADEVYSTPNGDAVTNGSKGEGKGKNDESEEDETEEEYLDDEQMMKLDSTLAEMFKLNRVGKKRRRDPSFKLRCLDLVRKVVEKKHSDGEVIKKILATIIPLAAKSRKSVDTRPISAKINAMVAKMPGKSKLKARGAP